MSRPTCLATILALAFLPALASAEDAADELTLVGTDRPTDGVIVKETFRDVVLRVANAQVTFAQDRVQGIRYGRTPLFYAEAIRQTRAGRWDEAESSWTKVLEESRSRQGRVLFVPHALFERAEVRIAAGRFEEARDDLKTFVADHPEGKRIVEAHRRLVRCLMRLGDRPGAVEAGKRAVREARERGMAEPDRLRLELLLGEAIEAAGDDKAALAAYRALSSAGVSGVAERARAAEGRCLARMGDFVEAERRLTALTGAATLPAALASAYQTLGDCALRRCERGGGAEVLREALLAYLRGVVLYASDEDEDAEMQARALVQAGWCFEKLRDASTDRAQRDAYRARAVRLYRECVAEHGGTPSAKRAGERLEEMK